MIDILTSIFIISSSYNVDPYLVAAVIEVESKFNARAVGSIGELGLMQLRPEYHAPSGDPMALFKPEVNIERGVKYLKEVEASCRHKDNMTYLVCYNTGVAGGAKINHPTLFEYYKRVTTARANLKQAKIFEPIQAKILMDSWNVPILSSAFVRLSHVEAPRAYRPELLLRSNRLPSGKKPKQLHVVSNR